MFDYILYEVIWNFYTISTCRAYFRHLYIACGTHMQSVLIFFLAFWQFFSYSQNFIFAWCVKRGEGGYLQVSLSSKLLYVFIHTMTCFSIICTNLWWELKTISELMLQIDLPTSYSKEQSTVTRSCNSGYQLREPLDLLSLDSLTWEALNNFVWLYISLYGIIFAVYGWSLKHEARTCSRVQLKGETATTLTRKREH